MFYVASKVFWVVAQPLSIALLFCGLGAVLLAMRRRRSGLTASGVGLLVLFLSGFTSLGALMIAPLEDRFKRPPTMPSDVSTIIILGGSTLARVSTARQRSELNDAGDRLVEGVRLASLLPTARIVFSGGSGMLDGGTEAEADTAQRFFLDMGIAPERLVLEGNSRNTDENAAMTADMLGASSGRALLVTSAFHMPRSMGLFERQGVAVVPWPVDYRSTGEEGFGIDVANPVHNLNTTSIALKEWIGLFSYWISGRIDTVFPAQAVN